MARKHAFFLVVLLAAAALAGFVAVVRTIDLAQATKATPTAPLTQSALEARLRELDRFEAKLREQLAAEPPTTMRTMTTTRSRTRTLRTTMTSRVARFYALAGSILGLFLAWAGIAAAPWPAQTTPAAEDPAAAALLAGRSDVDLHHAIDLLRNGCAADLALQILL